MASRVMSHAAMQDHNNTLGQTVGGSPRAWGVAALLLAASDALQSRLGAITVSGEISGFNRAASGHCYFNLKDSDGAPALLRCAMFRRAAQMLEFKPGDGQQVELRGRITVYEARGELQCVVEAMRPLGAGSLYELFLRLKAKLEAQGLFAAARKRELPAHPRTLGVITSTNAAALRDVLTTLARRAPQVAVIVYPCAVQGAQAGADIARAIELANARAEVDTLIICRGGGSLEDLWAFNDELVIRAIAASALPTLSGVGHETDVTLTDLAADVRAATPTAAAELAAPEQAPLLHQLTNIERALSQRQRLLLDSVAQRLDGLASRLTLAAQSLQGHRQRLAMLTQRAQAAIAARLQLMNQQLPYAVQRWARATQSDGMARDAALQLLAHRHAQLDPQRVLARGYALLQTSASELVVAPQQVVAGERLRVSLAGGQVEFVARNVKRLDH